METALMVQTPGQVALRAGPSVPWRIVVETFLLARVANSNTARSYRRALVSAFERIGRPTLWEVSGMDLATYRAALLQDGRAPGSHCLDLAAVRAFLKWSRKSHVGASPLDLEVIEDALSMPRNHVLRPYQVPSNPELAAMLRTAATPRDRALLGILAGAGLRVSEVVNLDVADVLEDPEGCAALHVRNGKGGKDRMVPIHAEIVSLIRCYLEASGRTVGAAGPLFRAHDRGSDKRGCARRISVVGASGVVARAVKAAGIQGKRLSPHSLRHGFAIRSLRSGGSVVAVAKILGHASISTTQRYLDHLETAELLAAVPMLPQ